MQVMQHTRTYNQGVREARIEGVNTVNILDLLGREADIQSLEIVLEMLHFAPSNNREDVRGLVHDICDGH